MTKEIEGNKLIQDYLGWELVLLPPSDMYKGGEFACYEFRRFKNGEVVETDDGGDSWCWEKDSIIPFHSRWDRLMPVVVEIALLGFPVSLYFSHIQNSVSIHDKNVSGTYEYVTIIRESEHCKLVDPKMVVWKAVVEFIEQYNKL